MEVVKSSFVESSGSDLEIPPLPYKPDYPKYYQISLDEEPEGIKNLTLSWMNDETNLKQLQEIEDQLDLKDIALWRKRVRGVF